MSVCIRKMYSSCRLTQIRKFPTIARCRAQPTIMPSSLQRLSTGKPSDSATNNTAAAVWRRIRTPALFGTGLYLGLMLFGEHRETKQGSEYFEGLRGMFMGDSNKKGSDDDDDRGKG